MSRRDGRLAIVLHTHMPYVEGFGTWPFGEEWLWEAAAGVYLPLLDLLEERPPLTLSVTPVLLDQLEAPGVHERLLEFLVDMRARTHALDAEGCRAGGRADLAAEVERAAGDYARAARRLEQLGDGGLARALAAHASWTSAATHAVLPLVATDAGVRLQVGAGIAAHRARSGGWDGGLWLPECAHAPWLDPLLAQAGVHATCVDLTDVFGPGDPAHLRPVATPSGPLLVPIDRATVELVWSDGGYPAHGAYRDYHHHTTHQHRPWSNDGAVYDRDRAVAQAHADARDFVARTRERVAEGGLAVCAMDTELLGHWWYEGQDWLRAVLAEAQAQGLEVVGLDEALAETSPAVVAAELPTTSWGTPRTLWTWSGPQVADLALQARAGELRVVRGAGAPDERAVRELLALQASDWAFLATRDTAGSYPRDRAAGHRAGLDAALAQPGTQPGAVRGLAPFADPALLFAP
jgi:1,4-alpha-glucan branching enzyme